MQNPSVNASNTTKLKTLNLDLNKLSFGYTQVLVKSYSSLNKVILNSSRSYIIIKSYPV